LSSGDVLIVNISLDAVRADQIAPSEIEKYLKKACHRL
jgi:hypothetical protein